jgi:F-type H+-transporting ATPase subunit a
MDAALFTTSLLAAAAEPGDSKQEIAHGISMWGLMAYLALVLVILVGLMAYAKTGLNQRVFKNKVLQAFEQVYLFIENMCVGIIGPHGRRYIPLILTFWLVIFVSNIVSLFFPTAPTADLGFNLGMALISIGYVQYEGIRANGFFGHFSHFAGPRLAGAMVIISAMIFVIELISEAMKNVSLSLRLYGNIEGGHQAADAMNAIGKKLVQIGPDQYVGVPFGAFLLPVKLLTCVVQALIFCLLTCVYLSLVTHHEHDESHGEGHAEGHELAAAH